MAKQGVSVALKIYLHKRLLPGLYAHVEALTKKFKDVEAAKPRNNAPTSEPAAKKAKAVACLRVRRQGHERRPRRKPRRSRSKECQDSSDVV